MSEVPNQSLIRGDGVALSADESAARAGTLVREQVGSILEAALISAADVQRRAEEEATATKREALDAANHTLERIDDMQGRLRELLSGIAQEADALGSALSAPRARAGLADRSGRSTPELVIQGEAQPDTHEAASDLDAPEPPAQVGHREEPIDLEEEPRMLQAGEEATSEAPVAVTGQSPASTDEVVSGAASEHSPPTPVAEPDSPASAEALPRNTITEVPAQEPHPTVASIDSATSPSIGAAGSPMVPVTEKPEPALEEPSVWKWTVQGPDRGAAQPAGAEPAHETTGKPGAEGAWESHPHPSHGSNPDASGWTWTVQQPQPVAADVTDPPAPSEELAAADRREQSSGLGKSSATASEPAPAADEDPRGPEDTQAPAGESTTLGAPGPSAPRDQSANETIEAAREAERLREASARMASKSDEQVAETFNEARGQLAEAEYRGDIEESRAWRALINAAAEEAASRIGFGQERPGTTGGRLTSVIRDAGRRRTFRGIMKARESVLEERSR